MHKLLIGGCNTDEVCETACENNSFGKHGEKEHFLALFDIDIFINVSHSRVESILLVDCKEVDDIPNAYEQNGDQGKDLWCEKQSSGYLGVFGEEGNDEVWSKQKWDEEDDANHCVPPVEIFVHEQEEIPDEHNEGYKQCNNTDSNDTAFDWHA